MRGVQSDSVFLIIQQPPKPVLQTPDVSSGHLIYKRWWSGLNMGVFPGKPDFHDRLVSWFFDPFSPLTFKIGQNRGLTILLGVIPACLNQNRRRDRCLDYPEIVKPGKKGIQGPASVQQPPLLSMIFVIQHNSRSYGPDGTLPE